MNLRDLSIVNLARKYRQLTRKDRENFSISKSDKNNGGAVAGGLVIVFVVLFLLALALWLCAVIFLAKYWRKLPSWAQIIGILGVLPIIPLGPVATLIVVFIGKGAGGPTTSSYHQRR